MFSLYLLTGATGFLGMAILKSLLEKGARLRALVLPGDPLAREIPPPVQVCPGRVDKPETLASFFEGDLREACLIHCAGIVSIASAPPPGLWPVNVEGTANLLALCRKKRLARVVYVSSVHAIPEPPRGQIIREAEAFSPAAVAGPYAQSKAEATRLALLAAEEGLNVSVVHPSGIIGPGDRNLSSTTSVMLRYCRRKLPVGVAGGYDFADVRDVAEGTIACASQGRRGQCYILSNRYAAIQEILSLLQTHTGGRKPLVRLPHGVIRCAAPLCEAYSRLKKQPPFLTPYSARVLRSNALFSHEKATRELGYHPRELSQTVADVFQWFRETKLIS